MPGNAGGGHSGGYIPTNNNMHTGTANTGGMHVGMPTGNIHNSNHYSTTGNTDNINNMNNNYNKNNKPGTKKGCLLPIIIAGLVFYAIVFVISFFDIDKKYIDNNNHYEQTIVEDSNSLTHTLKYHKLPEYLCTPYNGSLVDAKEVDFLEESDIKEIDEMSHYFYEKTGVEPYLLVLPGIDGEIDVDYDILNDYLHDNYTKLFGNEEGHIIFLFLTDGNEYYSWYIEGDDIEYIFDTELSDMVLSSFDNEILYNDIHESFKDAYTNALLNTADMVMNIRARIDLDDYPDFSVTQPDGIQYVTDIPVREKFLSEFDTKLSKEDLVNCDIKKFFKNDSEQAIISSKIDNTFTELTGVQPFILITDELETEIINDPAQINPILKSNYESVFGDDAHIFILISLKEKEPIIKYYVGPGARYTLDSDACETIRTMITSSFKENGITPEALVDAFEKSANTIMSETYMLVSYDFESGSGKKEDNSAVEITEEDLTEPQSVEDNEIIGGADEPSVEGNISIVAFALPILLVLAVIIFVVVAKKRKAAHDDEDYDTHRRETDYEKIAGYKGLENEFPVTCRYCKATAYLTKDGHCQYCGKTAK